MKTILLALTIFIPRLFQTQVANRGLGFLLPEGEYKMAPSLPPGYMAKSLTLDGTPVTADQLKLTAAEHDLQLRITLARQ